MATENLVILNIGTKTRSGRQLGTAEIVVAVEKITHRGGIPWVDVDIWWSAPRPEFGIHEGTAVVRYTHRAGMFDVARDLAKALEQDWVAVAMLKPGGKLCLTGLVPPSGLINAERFDHRLFLV